MLAEPCAFEALVAAAPAEVDASPALVVATPACVDAVDADVPAALSLADALDADVCDAAALTAPSRLALLVSTIEPLDDGTAHRQCTHGSYRQRPSLRNLQEHQCRCSHSGHQSE